METVIMLGDIVEKNGKTIRENRTAIPHNILVGTLVEVKYDKWLGNGASMRIEARLWVVLCNRDCDGSPLYSVAEQPMATLQAMVMDLCEWSGTKIATPNECIDDDSRREDYRFWHLLRGLGVVVERNFPEHSLTPVEVTEALKAGVGALNWEENPSL